MKIELRRARLAAAALLGLGAFALASPAAAGSLEPLKGADWALPQAPSFAAIGNKGQSLPNFAQVSPVLDRSGQPTQQGVSQLAAKGIKTILKLNDVDPAEADWAASAGIALVAQPLSSVSSPSYAEVDAALAVINDPARQPVLVHCTRGSDRTGAVVAAYRVFVQGESVAQAAAEAKAFGYGAPGFQDITTWLNGYVASRSGQ